MYKVYACACEVASADLQSLAISPSHWVTRMCETGPMPRGGCIGGVCACDDDYCNSGPSLVPPTLSHLALLFSVSVTTSLYCRLLLVLLSFF